LSVGPSPHQWTRAGCPSGGCSSGTPHRLTDRQPNQQCAMGAWMVWGTNKGSGDAVGSWIDPRRRNLGRVSHPITYAGDAIHTATCGATAVTTLAVGRWCCEAPWRKDHVWRHIWRSWPSCPSVVSPTISGGSPQATFGTDTCRRWERDVDVLGHRDIAAVGNL